MSSTFGRALIVVVALAALAVPSLAGAKPGHGPAKRAAVKACKEERREVGRQAFKASYGKHPFKTCVRRLMPEARNAAQECREERQDEEAFAAEYGTRRNAFGKCVSGKVSEKGESEETSKEPCEVPVEYFEEPGETPEDKCGEVPEEEPGAESPGEEEPGEEEPGEEEPGEETPGDLPAE